MEMKELMANYLALVEEKNKNLVNIAFDEMESSQYEDAAIHFDQLYVQDSTDYMSFFFRAYCKSHCGRRGDVYPDSQKLTSAFELSVSKALASSAMLDTEMYLLLSMYKEAMDNLAYNAVEEVHVDSNGNTYTTNPTKTKIYAACKTSLTTLMKTNVETFKKLTNVNEYCINYLKTIEATNLRVYGNILVLYVPEYAAELEAKIKKQEKKSKMTLIIIGVAFAVIAIASLLMGL